MASYVKSTDFASKDALLSGDPAKIIKGTEIDSEFNAIATAVSTKADTVSPTFTGTPLAPTASPGTNTTQIATTAFVTAADTAAVAAERSATATLTNKTINLTSNTLTGTVAQFNTALSDGDFATLAGTETLTNKTLTSPVLTTPQVNVINEATAGAGVTVDGVLIKDGAISGQYAPLFRDTAKTATGTSVDFTGIPSWVRRITVILSDVGNNAADGTDLTIRLGDSGGIESTGYVAVASTTSGNDTSSIGFRIRDTIGTSKRANCMLTLCNISGNTWIAGYQGMTGNEDRTISGGGRKTLSDVLTQIRVTTEGGASTFTSGSINIIYE